MNTEKLWLRCGVLLLVVLAGANMAVAQKSTATLLVVLKGDDALGFVDTETMKQTASVPVGAGAHEVAVSTDGKLAFVSNYGPNNGRIPGATISVVSVPDRKELRKLETGVDSKPHGVLFAGGKLFFTAEGMKQIGRYDPATGQIEWRFDVGQEGSHLLVITRDRKTIFVSNLKSNTISVIHSGPTGWGATAIPITGGGRPEGIALSPNGKEVWVSTNDDARISIIDVAARKVAAILDPQVQQPNNIKFTLDGKNVLINDTRGGQVVIVDAASRKVVKRVDVGKASQGMLIAPSGSRAYVACTSDNYIAIIDTKTFEVIGRIPTGKEPDGMAWAERR